MGATTTRLTYEAYLELPEIKRRYDIVDGVLEYMSPSPDYFHQKISKALLFALEAFVTARGSGEVMYAPLDVVISRRPLRTRQPDLLYLSTQHKKIVDGLVAGPPDVVVEILSPANTTKKLQAKLEDYARLGVPEVWVAAPVSKTVEVLLLEKGKYRSGGINSPGSPANSRVLAGFILPKDVFA